MEVRYVTGCSRARLRPRVRDRDGCLRPGRDRHRVADAQHRADVSRAVRPDPADPVDLRASRLPAFPGRMDELGRRIQLEALAFGFGAAGMLTFAYGFLENAGLPKLSYVFVFPLMIALWGIGGAIATRRYQ